MFLHVPWGTVRNVHSGSQDSVQKTKCYNSTSNAPDDGRMCPKHVELRIHQWNLLVASSWHFTLLPWLYLILSALNRLHASFPDVSILVFVPPGESVHSRLCFVFPCSRNACRESGTEVAEKGTAWPSPIRRRYRPGFITSFLRRAK